MCRLRGEEAVILRLCRNLMCGVVYRQQAARGLHRSCTSAPQHSANQRYLPASTPIQNVHPRPRRPPHPPAPRPLPIPRHGPGRQTQQPNVQPNPRDVPDDPLPYQHYRHTV
ncbi:hypothetical protein CALVIDRAFT_88618 [Calocera viscosa TUFC12733]|uniref:Uncharacterized protein n=1 Tax=Calocera viscosa (strain TUFC12733) TaxID=1330018 RepID=A0A167N7U0_CALVF|nr:hypothetical protein CALVIDRAFT_88618 [Calocera viscosa TUFC12733]